MSEEILDAGNGVLTTEVEGFDLREAVAPVAELALPEVVKCSAMLIP